MINKKFLLSLTVISVLFTACTEDKSTEDTTQKTESEQVIDKVANSVISGVETTAKKAEDIASSVQQSAAPVVKEVAEKIKVVQKEISETTMEGAKQKIVEASAPIIKKVTQVVVAPNGSVLYNKCAGCHGSNAEKKALNTSDIIQNWDSEKIANALKGYKDGTYGGTKKALMIYQTKSLTDKDIEALAKYIPTLK
jgi:cytochrome c553